MTESRCGSSSYLPSRDPKGLHAKAGYLLPVDHTRFYVEGLGAMPLESSSMVSALAFSASTRFAVEVGATTARISLKDLQESTAGMLNELFKSADEYISARHRYLNVEDLHSDGCLRAAFATVSEGTRIFDQVYRIGEQHRDIFKAETQHQLLQILEQVEDIQENLTLLSDDEARGELKRILEEAGIEGRPRS
jgi:hypothetical protein